MTNSEYDHEEGIQYVMQKAQCSRQEAGEALLQIRREGRLIWDFLENCTPEERERFRQFYIDMYGEDPFDFEGDLQ